MSVKWEKSNASNYPYSVCDDKRLELYNQFLNDFKIKYISDCYDIAKMGKFLDGNRSYNNIGKELVFEKIPYDDHGRVFKGEFGRFYVFHPYTIDLDALEQWCGERDIIYCFCEPNKSFYYPGRSYMVILMSDLVWEIANVYGIIMKYEFEGTERKFDYRR